MDYIGRFREMNFRRTIALTCLGLAVMLALSFSLAAWMFSVALVVSGSGLPLDTAATAGAVAVAGTAGVWWWADQLLMARLFDRRSLRVRIYTAGEQSGSGCCGDTGL